MAKGLALHRPVRKRRVERLGFGEGLFDFSVEGREVTDWIGVGKVAG